MWLLWVESENLEILLPFNEIRNRIFVGEYAYWSRYRHSIHFVDNAQLWQKKNICWGRTRRWLMQLEPIGTLFVYQWFRIRRIWQSRLMTHTEMRMRISKSGHLCCDYMTFTRIIKQIAFNLWNHFRFYFCVELEKSLSSPFSSQKYRFSHFPVQTDALSV